MHLLPVLKGLNVECQHRRTELWYNLGIPIFCYFILLLHCSLEASVVISIHFIYMITSVISYSEDNMQHQSRSSIFFIKVHLFYWQLTYSGN